MKIFVLEDDQERIKWLRQRLFNHDVTFVESCTQADQFVGGYDLVLLDHDLGGRVLVDHEDNGENFAKAIVKKLGDAFVVVHSFNRDGAVRIVRVIREGAPEVDVLFCPFRGNGFMSAIDSHLRDGINSESL